MLEVLWLSDCVLSAFIIQSSAAEEKFDSYPQAWSMKNIQYIMGTLLAVQKEVSTPMPMPKVFIGKVLMF
jgi:hypothetical protein